MLFFHIVLQTSPLTKIVKNLRPNEKKTNIYIYIYIYQQEKVALVLLDMSNGENGCFVKFAYMDITQIFNWYG